MRSQRNAVTFKNCLVYEQKLQIRTTGENSKNPGTVYINGTLDLATDDDCKNIVPVNFTYVTETYKSGKKNGTFTLLKKIIDNDSTVIGAGEAVRVNVDASIGVNDFYSDRNGGDPELVSARRIEGSFVTSPSAEDMEKKKNSVAVDAVITRARIVEANPERGTSEYVSLTGYTFNYNGSVAIPVELRVRRPGAIEYFNQKIDEISEKDPFYAQFMAEVIHSVEVVKVIVPGELGEFEEEKPRRVNEILVDNIRPPYEFDDENTLTREEFTTAVQNRNINLAEVKKRYDEYQAQKGNGTVFPTAPAATASTPTPTAKIPVATGNYVF